MVVFFCPKNRALNGFSYCTCALGEFISRRHLVGIFASVFACVYLSCLAVVSICWVTGTGGVREGARAFVVHACVCVY